MIPLATVDPGSSNNGYVAAAYIVFFAIVLIYVAIMALRLTRVERGLRELNERAETPRDGATRARLGKTDLERTTPTTGAGARDRMSELLALGISHKTAPVALRERLAFTEQEASEFARRPRPATRCARRS